MNKLKFNLIILLLFLGCEENTSQIIEKKSSVSTSFEKEDEKNNLLHQLGFDIKNEKITIDINQTNNFFENLEVKMQKKSQEIEKKIEASDFNFTKDIGIEFEGTHIGIDLNKTKSMIEKLNILMKDILLDINAT